ncbi:hypothetical protein POM88_005621 [Heracleum sosnowskyi]|uniref:Uncharacterized protein n=1 Tax=Heracleum sosnowskyi TaxID=360622 RepID=A0AAD8J369_9APIA|nr:hypothetical protein POM88_005621 [Heracleum sosnowskyi]
MEPKTLSENIETLLDVSGGIGTVNLQDKDLYSVSIDTSNQTTTSFAFYFSKPANLILIIPKSYSFKSDLVCSTFSIHPFVLNRRTMDQGNVSGSTPWASSSSVGMTSTKCDVNLSKSDQDCAIIIQEDDLSIQKNEPPAKKQKALTSDSGLSSAHFLHVLTAFFCNLVHYSGYILRCSAQFYAYFLHSFSAFFRFFMQSAVIFRSITTVSHVSDIVGTSGCVHVITHMPELFELKHRNVSYRLVDFECLDSNLADLVDRGVVDKKKLPINFKFDVVLCELPMPFRADILSNFAISTLKIGGHFVVCLQENLKNEVLEALIPEHLKSTIDYDFERPERELGIGVQFQCLLHDGFKPSQHACLQREHYYFVGDYTGIPKPNQI